MTFNNEILIPSKSYNDKKTKVQHYDEMSSNIAKQLLAQLSSIKMTIKTSNGEFIVVYKYAYLGSEYLKDIYAGEPELPFIISVSDLTPGLNVVLLDVRTKDTIVFHVVEKVLRDANPRLYQMIRKVRGSIPYTWRFG
jgi:hypothetical protein